MDNLIRSIHQKEVILFVGSGVSATLGLPNWSGLMDYIASELGIKEEVFSVYGDNIELAEYYYHKKGTIGYLRSWMDRNWIISDEKLLNSTIFRNICNLNFPIIYTTNYDNCLEKAHEVNNKEYNKIVKVEDLCNINNNLTQIIKFHGDLSDDNSIVLTESSYFNRMDFESPLDIKLRSDILGKSILFIGYSLSDINVRYLIYKLNKLWEHSGNENNRPKSYILLSSPNPVQELILQRRNIKPIIGQEINPQSSLDTFLNDLAQRIIELKR